MPHIDPDFYTLQLVIDTDHLTGLYTADNGYGKQILLKPGPDLVTESWFISPVKDDTVKDDVYLITKSPPKLGTPGFAPDADFDKVILDVPVKWYFYRVPEGPDVPPNVYFISPVEVPKVVGVGFYLGPNKDKDGAVITRIPVIPNPPPAPAWQVSLSPINK